MIRNCLSGIIKRASSRGSLLALPKYPITELKDELQFTQGFYDAIEDKLPLRQKGQFLRLEIFAGEGCEGFTYKFKFDQEIKQEDYVKSMTEISDKGEPVSKIIFAVNGEDVRLLKGAVIDYSQEMMRSVFYVKENPNAEIECSCKTSFSPKAGLF